MAHMHCCDLACFKAVLDPCVFKQLDACYYVQEELDFWANPVFENALDEETADGFVDGFNLVLDMASS